MSYRLSSLTQTQDERIAHLQLKIEAIHINQTDIQSMDSNKTILANKLISLETQKVDLMKRLQYQLEGVDKELVDHTTCKSKYLQLTKQLISQMEKQEYQMRNYDVIIKQKQERFKQLRAKQFKMRDEREILLKQQKGLNEEHSKLQQQANVLQYERGKLEKKSKQLKIDLDNQTLLLDEQLMKQQSIKSQIMRSVDDYKIVLKNLEGISDEVTHIEGKLNKQIVDSKMLAQQLDAKQSRNTKLSHHLSYLKQQQLNQNMLNKQIKQAKNILLLTKKNKALEFSTLMNNNERLMKEQSQLKASIQNKEMLVKALMGKVEEVNGSNRLVRMQLESMRMDDMNVKGMLDMKWKEFECLVEREEGRRYEGFGKCQSVLKELELNTGKIDMMRSTEAGFYSKQN